MSLPMSAVPVVIAFAFAFGVVVGAWCNGPARRATRSENPGPDRSEPGE
jgi:hypothetical protein